MVLATINLHTSSLEINGFTIACASKTPKGWCWFSNVGRVGRKDDFKSKEAALRAAAKAMCVEIIETIEEANEIANQT